MLSWIRSWFAKKEEEDAEFGYVPERRVIYPYFDGKATVRADPIVLYRKYSKVKTVLHADAAVAQSPSKAREEKYLSTLVLIRDIFGVKELDQEGGLTEQETVDLLNDYLGFMELLKKSTRTPPTSPAGTSPATPPAAATPPTVPSSASGSTASGPCTEPPTPSASASPSPTPASAPDSSTGSP